MPSTAVNDKAKHSKINSTNFGFLEALYKVGELALQKMVKLRVAMELDGMGYRREFMEGIGWIG